MSPLRALVHAFLGRFFENESTLGRTDLRESFLRLIGMLAAPAMFWAFWQSFRWDLIVRARGIEGLHVAVLYDKTLFLTFTYVAVGMLACLVWPSLVVDRRDGLVLGVLPVRLRTIVVAKLGAVFGYIGLISGGMHVGASAMFGTFLSGGHPLSLVRGIAGHFIAMCGVALFTFLSMSALAAMGLAIFGPRRFSRISGSLQIVCVAIVTAGLAMFPIVTGRVVPVLTSADPGHSWIVYTPPIWFLGLYETIAGTTLPIMSGLARTAVIALAIAVTTLAAFYPIGCARVLASAAPVKPFARRWSSRLTETMVRLLAGDGPVRGALQFAMATIGRVQQHRLTIAMAVGIFLTFAVPLTLSRLSPAEAMPRRSFLLPMLAMGPLLMFLLSAAARVALALPAELGARWLFKAVPSPVMAGRVAARRLIYLVAVAPAAVLSVAVGLWFLGPQGAVRSAVVVAFSGVILTDIHLWGFASVPCARPIAPGSASLQSRWPWYLAGLYVMAGVIPEVIASNLPVLIVGLILAATAVVVRRFSNRATAVTLVVEEEEAQFVLLDVSVSPRKPGAVPNA